MAQESRTKKTFLNARINTICYFVGLLTAFFTRKILLDSFGAEFIGLTATLQGFLGFLNLAELGVGVAIGYVLYKPIYDQNREKIIEIISVLGYLYRMIGFFILGAGLVLSCFLPLLFKDTNLPLWIVFLGFYAYLSSTLLTYFANYSISLLAADQKMYKYTGVNQLVGSSKVVLQMFLAYYTKSLWLFLAIELVFAVVNAVIIHRIVRREYPWLATQVSKGRVLLKEYPDIMRYIKQLFIHKLGEFVQYQTQPLFIYAYVSLPMVALYTNYTTITTRLNVFLFGVFSSVRSSIGNLVAEGDAEKTWRIFKELFVGYLFVAGVCSASIYYLIDDFIAIWVGEQYVFAGGEIALLIACNFFLLIARGPFDHFLHSYGLFSDVWAPFVEAALSLVCSLLLGYYLGLAGVIAAPILPLLIIVYGWKPYFLFSKGLKQPVIKYVGYLFLGLIPIVIAYFVAAFVTEQAVAYMNTLTGWWAWIAQSAVFFVCHAGLTCGMYLAVIPDFRHFVGRFIKRRKA